MNKIWLKRSFEEWIVLTISYLIVGFLALACLFPMLRILAFAFSRDTNVLAGKVGLFPSGLSFDSIRFIVNSSVFTGALYMSTKTTVMYVVLSMLMTVVFAYPLSKNYIPGIKFFRFFMVFTMLFSGGLIPGFLVVRSLGLINTIWALIIPGLISPFNAIILITHFRSIDIAYEEAARIEGASHFSILYKIYVPMSIPTILTLLLFFSVGRWNGWFDVIIYINRAEMYTLQVVLRNLLAQADNTILKTTSIVGMAPPLPSVQAASVVFAILPIIVVYPFIQKYFVKGILIGGIKG